MINSNRDIMNFKGEKKMKDGSFDIVSLTASKGGKSEVKISTVANLDFLMD